MSSKVIIACDFDSERALNAFLSQFGSEKLFLKLGMQLIYNTGFDVISQLHDQGHEIFLDLKLHDISNTMIKTLASLKKYPIAMLTIHLTVGKSTLQQLHSETIKLLGVSVLTNLNDQDVQQLFLNGALTVEKLVVNLSAMAAENKLAGVVCSAQESQIIKKLYPDLLTICPGVQITNLNNDQKRTVSPLQAKQMQADYIVVGRAITTHPQPLLIYKQIKTIFEGEQNA